MSDLSHPNFSKEVKVEQHGREVRLIFVAHSRAAADGMYDMLVEQLKSGSLNITLLGTRMAVEKR